MKGVRRVSAALKAKRDDEAVADGLAGLYLPPSTLRPAKSDAEAEAAGPAVMPKKA